MKINGKKDTELVSELNEKFKKLKSEIGKIIVGQDGIIDNVLVSILSQGHSLLIGVPGLGKTLIIKTLADALDLKFSRIQFTPDLMPSDITGTEVFEAGNTEQKFRFIKGPVFANIILADEINRTPPKTQSALLEAMQEHRVTSGGVTFQLDEPFFVLATQNPIEQEGTYPLPEAQLDRFMFNIWLDYPAAEEEEEIVKRTTSMYDMQVNKVFSKREIIDFQQLVRKVPVSKEIIEYIVNIVSLTRPANPESPKTVKDYVNWGAGPRASQYLTLAAKAGSILNGRITPSEDDVIKYSLPVLRHRVITNFNAEADNIKPEDIIKSLIK
jgi:MoxR-like ATPase